LKKSTFKDLNDDEEYSKELFNLKNKRENFVGLIKDDYLKLVNFL